MKFSAKKGVIHLFAAKVAVAFVGLITVILTSKYLGAEGRGIVSLFTSSVALLQLFCDFGCSSVLINLSYRINQRRLWLTALSWVTLVCLVSYIFACCFSHIRFIFWVPVAAFLFSLVNIHSLLLMGNLKVTRRNIILVLQPVLVLLFFLLLYFVFGLNLEAFPVAFIAALVISAMVSYLFIYKKIQKGDIRSNEKFSFVREVFTQGFWVQSGHAIQFLNYRINFFIIIFFMGNAALGIYNNAIVIAEALWILGHSIGQIMHMKILNTKSDHEHRKISNKMMLVNFSGTIVMLGILITIPTAFWEWLFSKEFSSIKGLFVWLAPGILFFSISNILNHYFHARNRFKLIVWCNIAGLITGLSLCILLVPEYHLNGACMAWSAGLFAAMLVYVIAYINAGTTNTLN